MDGLGTVVDPVGERTVDDVGGDVKGGRVLQPGFHKAWDGIVIDKDLYIESCC